MQIVPVDPDDAADVHALAGLRAAWHGGAPTDSFHVDFARWLADEGASRRAWLARDDRGGPCGMVTLKVFDRMPSPDRPATSWGYLANLFVLEDYRGRGAGGLLIDTVVNYARAKGMVRVVLAPTEPAIPLYTRHGFAAADDLLLLRL